ncbi:Oidioi.mRNA.OKI2018_I69.chr2.g4782.t1.cds [Oikopleura dioica]|uniref:Oidioi.mRNA.OKI2018_I69.chr2.g4782.t1.cds n=1 Tax=Oikopleura dioica TaxID=34765 RepID=A0ABN7SYH3_OIKDI|nr:Oidioi.mRNA.OKI2018_I69.chr2.g4782.t1.cds [Oikopleura dioica]
MKISPLLFGAAMARNKGPMWEYDEEDLPPTGKTIRIKSGSSFEIDYLAPSEEEESFIFFVDAENIDAAAHKFKSSENVLVEAMYKITPDSFGTPFDAEIAESEASIDREQEKIKLSDHSAGYYISVLKNKETKKIKTDDVVDVHVVEGCSIKASWDHDIEWEKFGWHESGGSLSFNPVGFNENDVFARCEFPSTPASSLRWKDSDVQGANLIERTVPSGKTHFDSSFLECELLDREYDEDECSVVQTKSQILIPPMKSQYTEDVFADDAHKVWHYVDSTSDYQKVHFTCPLDIYAKNVRLVSFINGNLYESDDFKQVSNALPDVAEDLEPETDELMVFETTLDGYEITLDMAGRADGVAEFRCKYSDEDDLMGYSQPHVIVKSPEANPDIATLEVSGSWGSGIATENHVISVTSELVNIASCSQNAPGYPAELSIKFHKDGHDYYTPLPGVNKHSISVNRDVPVDFDLTTVSCVVSSGNETKEIELGTLNVMHEPENVMIFQTPEQFKCTAEYSQYDTVTASLTLNRNVKQQMENGEAVFNRNSFTEEELSKIYSTGAKCVVTSENFEGKWESEVLSYNIDPEVIDTIKNNPLGFLAMTFFAALAVIGICVYMPKNEPPQYKQTATEVDDEDPLHNSKSELA